MLARLKFGMIVGEVAAKLGLKDPEFDEIEANYATFTLPANCKGLGEIRIIRRGEENFVDLKFYEQFDRDALAEKKSFECLPKGKLTEWISLYIGECK